MMLVESLLSVLDEDRMGGFHILESRLKQVFDFFVAKFTEARQSCPVVTKDHPNLPQMLTSLEVLLAWVRMHQRQLEHTAPK